MAKPGNTIHIPLSRGSGKALRSSEAHGRDAKARGASNAKEKTTQEETQRVSDIVAIKTNNGTKFVGASLKGKKWMSDHTGGFTEYTYSSLRSIYQLRQEARKDEVSVGSR